VIVARRCVVLSLCAMSVCATMSFARAEEKLDDPVKYRQSIFSVQMHSLRLLVDAVKAKRTADTAEHELAQIIHLTAKRATRAFPPKSEGGRAAKQIWTDPNGWQNQINNYLSATAELVRSTQPGTKSTDMARAVTALSKACKGCHDEFRTQ
jgi:cytochrome c556